MSRINEIQRAHHPPPSAHMAVKELEEFTSELFYIWNVNAGYNEA